MKKIALAFATILLTLLPLASTQAATLSCPNPQLTRALSRGSSGADVVSLQLFLTSAGFLASGNNTGYFGALTEAAVQRFQSAQGIVSSGSPSTTGYGATGPKTRQAIVQVCSTNFAPPPPPTTTTYTPPPPSTSNPTVISYFTASPASITAGQQSVLNWSVQNASGCVLSQQVAGQASVPINVNTPMSGSYVVTPQTTIAYTLLCTSAGTQTFGAVQSVAVTVGAGTGTGTPTPGLCVALLHELNQNDTDATTDGDVSRLQQFLGQDSAIYPENLVTGVYGPATARAVARFNTAHGAYRCDSHSFSASPTTGSTPLAVSLSARGLDETYFVDFGDGAQGNFTSVSCSTSPCTSSITHTYAGAGSYVAKLKQSTGDSSSKTVGIAKITATDPSAIAKNCVALLHEVNQGDSDLTTDGDVSRLQKFLALDPAIYPEGIVNGLYGPKTAAAVQKFIAAHGTLRCDSKSFTATPSTGVTPLSVKLTAIGVDERYYLDFGDSTQGEFTSSVCDASGVCPFSATHVYKKAGTYFASLNLQTGSSTATTVAGAKIVVANSDPFTVTPTSGASPLNVTFTGSYDGQYSINFGDGTPVVASTCDPSPCPVGALNLSHTYTATTTSASKITATLTDERGDQTATITLNPAVAACTTISHDMQSGDTDADDGGDVSALQSFLKSQGTAIYPEALVSGFYGKATVAAVKRFQQLNNIQQTGSVGPLTRTAIIAACKGTPATESRYSFTAAGQPALHVNFIVTGLDAIAGSTYQVDFADGSDLGTLTLDSAGNGHVEHNYATGGTYTARLLQDAMNLCAAGDTSGSGCIYGQLLDKVTVAVASPVDVCANIEGAQTVVPSGMTRDNSGNCVVPPPPPPPPPPPAPVTCVGNWNVTYTIRSCMTVTSNFTVNITSVGSDGSFSATIPLGLASGVNDRATGSCNNGTIQFDRYIILEHWTGTYTSSSMSGTLQFPNTCGNNSTWSATKQ